ncbi:CheR family methyltransferase [uncultured Xylophilus sp.]|uniref:CheR family methyltransferase n=1 Tax=uncultured Xylophilus sp. TaxID=296832 RepID=UPI0025E1EB90|nr:CheR family methyltransferase [uncultured Xylophilus sp.]
MEELNPDHAEEAAAHDADDATPVRGNQLLPLVGLGGSAGALPALRTFLGSLPLRPGVAFVVVVHLPPDEESRLQELLQPCTPLRVVAVAQTARIEPDTVYLVPPRKTLRSLDGYIALADQPAERYRQVAVDLFFRTLADTHGPHATAVVLSGSDGDGAIGLKRIKERGGLTVVQDPGEAEYDGMPRAAIDTGMVDWVLPVGQIAARVLAYCRLEHAVRLPPEEPAGEAVPAAREEGGSQEAALRDVLAFLRGRTGRNFSYYKRATILRRIGRRMQVNGVAELRDYLDVLRTRPGEAGALLQDLLISVTNFFRDADSFDALQARLPRLFAGKGPSDTLRVWTVACATGEEAYSIAMLLTEHARTLEAPPMIQVFATDLDEDAIRVAREGLYPPTIQADVNEDRLRRFFVKELGGLRVRRELREMVLFAVHDVLKDSPFSRLDLVTCRNLMIYLTRPAQARLVETFHFAMQPEALLMLGASESIDEASPQFAVLDKKHRFYAQRPLSRSRLPLPETPGAALALSLDGRAGQRPGGVFAAVPPFGRAGELLEGRAQSWGDMHLQLVEQLAPPSLLVDAEYELLHLSPSAGRFLQFAGGEPTRNLLRAIHPSLRIELRAALYQAAQSGETVDVMPLAVDLGDGPATVGMRVVPAQALAPGLLLVFLLLQTDAAPHCIPDGPATRESDAAAHHLDRELERLKSHLRDTVEQYEASTEELKASNEELQAMNEELRSATEELETSREELQSINEELTTVNQELKSKVDQLGNANSDMHNLMDATAIATVFLDRALCITRYTPAAVVLFHLIPTDVGRPLSDLKTRLHYPELDEDAHRVLDELVPLEREVGQAGGQWFMVRARPYRTLEDRIAGVVISFVDITERKRAEDALRASEERLRLVIENATEYAIFSTDLQRAITSWNAGAQRLLGYTEDEIVGQPCDLLFTDADRAADVPAREARTALEGRRALLEHRQVRKDGSQFWASGATMAMHDRAGDAVGFVKILRDQSEERAARHALEDSQAELVRALQEKEAARAALEAADATKERFLAVLSHELRNPLAAIHGVGEMLDRGAPSADDPVAQAGQVVRRQASTMKVLLDDLLDMSRLRLGKLVLRTARVAVGAVVEAAVEAVRPQINAAGHRLALDVPIAATVLRADPVRLSQVLSNLLGNAAKYTPPGGRVGLSARCEGDAVVFEVSDDGIGMAPESVESMFEMFRQAPGAHGEELHGMGIGLALVRSLVELHGGRVTGSSAGPGRGSRFTVTLPLPVPAAPVPAPAMPAAPVGTGADAPADGRPPRLVVLIADDNADAAWALAHLFARDGHTVHRATDGPQALEAARTHRPDVLLLDIGMPGLDGWEVVRRIRAEPWGAGMLILAATGWGQDDDRRRSAEAGADAHLVKPVDHPQIRALIADWVRRRGAAGTAR